jgi:type I restriction enzyme S subunit
MTNQIDGKIVSKNLQYVDIEQGEFEKFKIEYGDILFNRTNSFELVGRTAIFDIDGNFVFASYLIRLRSNKEKLNSFFLNHYFNWEKTQILLKGIATRAVSQSNISASRLKGFSVPLPKKLEEQGEIVKNLDYCDCKIAVHRQKCDILNDLFRTLLHQLMTAQIRVDDLNLSALNLEPQGGEE